MTAFFVVKTARQLSILSDTSTYKDDGILADTISKVHKAPGWNGVLFGNGPVMSTVLALGAADAFPSLDAFVADSADMIAAAVEESRGEYGYVSHVFAAGWSDEAQRPRIYCMPLDQSVAWPTLPLLTWTMLPDDQDFTVSPSSEAFPAEVVGWLASKNCLPGKSYKARDFDPAFHGVAMFDAIRNLPLQYQYGDATCVVGGSLELTVLDRTGTKTRTLHQWPDRIGEYIRPAPLWAVRDNVVAMSRQQRRAKERQDRKAARAS